MELNEKLNQSYNKDKSIYEKVSKFESDIKILKAELKIQKRAQEDATIKKIRAQEDKDKTKEKNADEEIKRLGEKIEEIKSKIEKKQQIISKSKEKVDAYIKELSKDPEFEAHINSILEKRYNRAIKKAIKEKEQTDLIIDLCTKHPSLENNLKGMIRANEEFAKIKEERKKLDDELKTLDPIKDKARIDEIQNTEYPTLASRKMASEKKNNINENDFMSFCEKNNVNIDREFLKNLVKEKSFAHDKNGNIQALKSLKKISKGYDQQVKNFEKSIEKIPNAKIYEETKKQTNTTRENDKKALQKEETGGNLPDKTYKWYQFRKRFSAWKEKRRVQKEAKENNDNEKDKSQTKESTNKFKNAYKYDIVKDYVDRKEKEIYIETARETRKETKKEETER